MIESIEFKNFRVLRDAKLPLGRCTVLVGPNGSGKSTVLQALETFAKAKQWPHFEVASALPPDEEAPEVAISIFWGGSAKGTSVTMKWNKSKLSGQVWQPVQGALLPLRDELQKRLRKIRTYAFDATAIVTPVEGTKNVELSRSGAGLANVLSNLQDGERERWDALNQELSNWLPEFDRVRLHWDDNNRRVFLLWTKDGHLFPAKDLSQGTVIALAILTLAYLAEPPSLVGLEEPDRGIHPRLLNRVRDALYRLAYPESCGEDREPVQVIATTHSPYFLDLFRDHPEEVVLAMRTNGGAQFERLSDRADIEDILGDAPLGEAWYSGVLGGVPTEP